MIANTFSPGQPVCWRDKDGVWHHGTVRGVANGSLEVENSGTETVERIDGTAGCALPPRLPFKTSTHPKTPESRVFLHAVSDAIEEVGVSWDDIGLVWNKDIPTVVFAPSVAESRIDSVRLVVEQRIPDEYVPKQHSCETLQLYHSLG